MMHPLVDEMIDEIIGTVCACNDNEVDVRVQKSPDRVQIKVNAAGRPVMDIILNLTRSS